MKNLAAIILMLTSFSCSIVLGSQGAPVKQTDQEAVPDLGAKFPKLKEAVFQVATNVKLDLPPDAILQDLKKIV